VQQTLPVSAQIYDIAFLNKDTGFVALNSNNFLRTTNGGTNWVVVSSFRIGELSVGDNNTLFGAAADGSRMYRTFDGGASFDSVGAPGGGYCTIYFVNKDTGWSSGLTGIFMTTNSGNSYQLISTDVNCGLAMFFVKQKYNNENYGFFENNAGFMFKTTNSGSNWIGYGSGIYVVYGFYFLNRDTGWVAYNPPTDLPRIVFTTNGGTNWILQYVDSLDYNATQIFFANINKGWAGRGWNKNYATTNGGLNWGLQDQPVNSGSLFSFIDSLSGWSSGFDLTKTTNGGGIITYLGIDSNSTYLPKSFVLEQNYPNPFNPQTTIFFSISKNANVSLIIYNSLGKEVLKIYDNKYLNIGNYKAVINFSKLDVASGIYFYTLNAATIQNNKFYTKSKKMVYVK
jgi:hypothetical protein